MPKPPLPPKAPLWQMWLKTDQEHLSFFLNASQYGDIVKLPRWRHFFVNDPTAIQEVLQHKSDIYTKVGTFFDRLQKMLGPGLLVNSGLDWQATRHLVQQAFHYKNFSAYDELISEQIAESFARFDLAAERQQTIALNKEMLMLVAKISVTVLLGIKFSFEEASRVIHQVAIGNEYVGNAFTMSKWWPTPQNVRFQWTRNQLSKFLREKLALPPSLPRLLEPLFEAAAKGEIDENALIGEMKNFFVAGHETTGNALSWTLLLLTQYPEAKAKACRESAMVSQKNGLNFQSLEKLAYVEQVLCESMRINPPIWATQRRALQDDILQGYFVPAQTNITISPYVLHRHPQYWPNPEEFRPERFSPEETMQRPKLAYIPFGAGPRVCIGKHLAMVLTKWILAAFITRYDWEIENAADIRPKALITLCPDEVMQAKLSFNNTNSFNL